MLIRESLLEAAAACREADQLPYFGALSPQEVAALLAADPQTHLVDVRMRAELDQVDTPDISPSQFAHMEWNQYPDGARSANFLSALEAVAPKDVPALFLCRSAARSKHAVTAVAQAGYAVTMDVLKGFEGVKDTEGYHKTVEGWCFRGLPWYGT